MAIIEVGGVYGVGKTTTIERAARLTKKEVPILKGSVIMARILGVSTEDLPAQLPEIRSAAREIMFKELNEAKNGVRDSHFCVDTDNGYEYTFTESDIGLVAAVVLLEASKETVLARRMQIKQDRSKNIDHIKEHIMLERNAAELFADKLHAPLVIIKNELGNAASYQMAEIFDEYLD